MAMNGMAEAAQDELVTRYFEQAVAQGMNPIAALELAQKAASDMLGPLRQAATSEEIWGGSSPDERRASPRIAIADDSGPSTTRRLPARREPRAMVTSGDDFTVRRLRSPAPRAMVTSGGGTVRPYVRRNTPAEAAALMETALASIPVQGVPIYDDAEFFPPEPVVTSGDDFSVRPFVRRNTPAENAALMETAAGPRAMVTSGDDFAVRPYVRRTTPEELAAMMEPRAMVTSGGGTVRPYVRRNTPEEAAALMETAAAPRAMMTAGGGTVRPYVRRNTPEEAAALMETAALPMVSSGDDFAVRPYVRRNTPEEVAALMETAAAYEEPRVVRSPGVYDMAPDMMRDRALEEAAARAFDAPPPPPVTLERASLADSLLRALGLR